MIRKECFSSEWINSISEQFKYKDKNLIEKVIRALSLLELLAKSGCPFTFKGGTALMLIMKDSVHRLSIDIDIICPPGTNVEDYIGTYLEHGFTDIKPIERKQRTNVPKTHSKFFYQIAYKDDLNIESYILLDVLYEELHYFKTNDVKIESPFIDHKGDLLTVVVPSVEDILGDKLTAFAPNTTGIPYYKREKSFSMEIIKQLYDVGRLFNHVKDISITRKSFCKIGEVELSYRELENDLSQVYDDIRETALCISTRGKVGNGKFYDLQDGINRVKSFMYGESYNIENAIVDSARAVYLATLIEKGKDKIEYYSGSPEDIVNLTIKPSFSNKLNKLRSYLPEAYYYWVKTSELL